MARSRYHVLETRPHFVTCTVVNLLPLFSQIEIAQIILDSLQFMQDNQRIDLSGYVIMENHLHLLVSAANLSKEMGNFKFFTARSIINWLQKNNFKNLLKQLKINKLKYKTEPEYQVWQEGFNPQAIFSDEVFRQKLEYIHNNPLRRGYVDHPAHWRYSSYRNYIGEPGVLSLDKIDF